MCSADTSLVQYLVFHTGFYWEFSKRKCKEIETADGKRRDEEGCEMGVWVVLSGGGVGGGVVEGSVSVTENTALLLKPFITG